MVTMVCLGMAATTDVLKAGATVTSCENEAVRAEQHATYLSGCRAYELVTPVDATPFENQTAEGESSGILATQAASDGDAISWFGYYPIEGSQGGFYNVSTLGKDGWESQSVIPREFTSQGPALTCSGSALFSMSIDEVLLEDGEYSDGLEQEGDKVESPVGEYCGGNDPPLVSDEPQGFQNLFLSAVDPVSYELVNQTSEGVSPSDAILEDATPELNNVIFAENAALVPGALSDHDLYDWSEGDLHLVNVLPNGAAAEARIADYSGPGLAGEEEVFHSAATYANAVSSGGTRIFFRSAEDKLYVRINPTAEKEVTNANDAAECGTDACTLQVDASHAGGSGGGGKFLAASADGSKVFFVDEAGADLTSDTATGVGESLYEYEPESGSLVDLTPTTLSKKPDVLGFSGISENGAYFYFAAEGSLAAGAKTLEDNLYVFHEGTISLVATPVSHGSFSEDDWEAPEAESLLRAESSPSGEYFAFTSTLDLTGYDNADVNTGKLDKEIYLYRPSSGASASSLSCVSCDPDGAQPIGPSSMEVAEEITHKGPGRLRRMVLDDGAVFFESPDPLVEGVEKAGNVYEYRDGVINIISGGKSQQRSVFYEATPNGEDVFFVTTQALVRRDTNNGLSLYDARVNGGHSEPSEVAECDTEECHGSYSGSTLTSEPASNSLVGPGNQPKTESLVSKSTKQTRAEKLAKALKGCEHDKKKRARKTCERRARRRYGAAKKKKSKATKSGVRR